MSMNGIDALRSNLFKRQVTKFYELSRFPLENSVLFSFKYAATDSFHCFPNILKIPDFWFHITYVTEENRLKIQG
jgi:hypothetical protein